MGVFNEKRCKNNKKNFKTFLENQKMDIFFVHFSNARKVLPKKTCFVTIIENYRKGAKKIIFNLLRQIFPKNGFVNNYSIFYIAILAICLSSL